MIDALYNLMAFCDISLDKALPTATRNPARMVGIEGSVGTLDKGKYADCLVLDPEKRGRAAIRSVTVGGITL